MRFLLPTMAPAVPHGQRRIGEDHGSQPGAAVGGCPPGGEETGAPTAASRTEFPLGSMRPAPESLLCPLPQKPVVSVALSGCPRRRLRPAGSTPSPVLRRAR